MGWKLFGHETSPAQLPAELRSILAQMQRERVAFETLTTGARESAQQLTQLSQPIADAQKVVTELQGRVKALERLAPVLATLDDQTEAVSRTQRRTSDAASASTRHAARAGAARVHVEQHPRVHPQHRAAQPVIPAIWYRSRYGTVRTHCRTGTHGSTASTRWAARSVMR